MPECRTVRYRNNGNPVRYRNAMVPDWDAGCRNTDAGGIGLMPMPSYAHQACKQRRPRPEPASSFSIWTMLSQFQELTCITQAHHCLAMEVANGERGREVVDPIVQVLQIIPMGAYPSILLVQTMRKLPEEAYSTPVGGRMVNKLVNSWRESR